MAVPLHRGNGRFFHFCISLPKILHEMIAGYANIKHYLQKQQNSSKRKKNKLRKARHVWLLAIAGTPSCVEKAFVVFQELRVIHLTWQVGIEYHFCFGVCINIPPSTKTNSSQTQHYLCNWANIINRKLRGLGQLEYVLRLRLSTGAPTPALNAM